MHEMSKVKSKRGEKLQNKTKQNRINTVENSEQSGLVLQSVVLITFISSVHGNYRSIQGIFLPAYSSNSSKKFAWPAAAMSNG